MFLDQLRRHLGDERFSPLMNDFLRRSHHSGRNCAVVPRSRGRRIQDADGSGRRDVPGVRLRHHLATALLVYGTVTDAGANRYAAEQLQKQFLDSYESAVPMRKDFEVTEGELRSHDVIFVGRPETNSALGRWKDRSGWTPRRYVPHCGWRTLPKSKRSRWRPRIRWTASHMVLVLAGNSALSTVHMTKASLSRAEYAIFDSGEQTSSGFVK